MWQRFTERARRVILLGQEEAGRMGSGYVGTEHLLVGLLLEDEGVGAQILRMMDVDIDLVRSAIEAHGHTSEFCGVEPKLTPRAKRVLELAADESRRMRHNYIGTEHLLLALLRDRDGLAAEILLDSGFNLDDVRRQVLELLGADVPETKSRRQGKVTLKSQTQVEAHGQGWVTLQSRSQIAVTPGFQTLLVHAQRRARESGSNTVNVLHFLQVLLQPENKAEVDLLKECGLDVEKGLTELVQRYRADDTDSAEDK